MRTAGVECDVVIQVRHGVLLGIKKPAAAGGVQCLWFGVLPAVSMIAPPPWMSPMTCSAPLIRTGPFKVMLAAVSSIASGVPY